MARALAILVCLVLAACAGIPRDFEKPEISFVGIRGVEASLFEQRLELRLRVQNPNPFELPVNGLDVDVELDGDPFATGTTARQFTVPAGGEAEFDMNVTANAASAILKLVGGHLKPGEAIAYRLSGKLSTRLGLLRTIPFEDSGTLALSDLGGLRRKGE